MKASTTYFRLKAAIVALLLISGSAYARPEKPRKIEFAAKSKEATICLEKIIYLTETMQSGPEVNALAKKAVEADPEFAYGYYLLGATSGSLVEGMRQINKAVELAKNATDGERRYIEAAILARSQKLGEAISIHADLGKQFPEERLVQMQLGQIYALMGKLDEAEAAYERAIQLDGSTPRAYAFLGNIYLLKGAYDKARGVFQSALDKRDPKTAPFVPSYGLVFAHIYEGNLKSALQVLKQYQVEYTRPGVSQNLGPPVFIWNSIGRLLIEIGKPEEAIKAYENGYATVPGSSLSESDKKIWLGRLHHGKGRALAKMGKYEEVWKEADFIRK